MIQIQIQIQILPHLTSPQIHSTLYTLLFKYCMEYEVSDENADTYQNLTSQSKFSHLFYCICQFVSRFLSKFFVFGDSRTENSPAHKPLVTHDEAGAQLNLPTTPSLTQLPLAPSMLLDSSSSARFLCVAHLCKN